MVNEFENLKVGDKVCFDRDSYNSIPTITTVGKVTKTMIICSGMKFRKINGYKIGNSDHFHFPKIKILTHELRTEITRNILLVNIQKCDFSKLSNHKLNQIYTVIKGN